MPRAINMQVSKPAYAANLSVAQWCAMPNFERGLHLARFFIDLPVVEEPKDSNQGYWVNRFQKRAGAGGGQPYCACFVFFCENDAGYEQHELPRHPAAVFSWVRWAEEKGLLVNHPERGDLFFWLDGSKGHIGFVAEVKGDKFRTLEGNTDAKGSREGGGCYEKWRTFASLQTHAKFGFIRMP